MSMHVEIRQMTKADWDKVSSIYLDGIATGEATFEISVPSWEKWDASHLSFARLVIVSAQDGLVKGWAALSPVSTRPVYNGVAEVSVYVAGEARGLGLGTALLERLIKESEQNGIWTLQAGIFPENQASIVLHQSLGFRLVGTRERIGKLNGIWRDTVLLERRSAVIGC
jgi:L-amino acid N-acyltransferase YncA